MSYIWRKLSFATVTQQKPDQLTYWFCLWNEWNWNDQTIFWKLQTEKMFTFMSFEDSFFNNVLNCGVLGVPPLRSLLQSTFRLSYRQKWHESLWRKGRREREKARRSRCFEVFFLLPLCHLCRQSKANICFLCSYLFCPLTRPNSPRIKISIR